MKGCNLAMGSFDGIHMGHRKILAFADCVLTFTPHPRIVLGIEKGRFILTSDDEKRKIFDGMGIEAVFLRFDDKIARMEPEEFVEKVLADIRPSRVVVGDDHRFGRGKKGDTGLLKQLGKRFGFDVVVVPSVMYRGERVSSTRIRRLIREGNVKDASFLLERNYSLLGEVKRGEGLGKRIGFPTANLHIPDPYKLIPGDGVYKVKVRLEDRMFTGMMHIGRNIKGTSSIEVHILGFDGELYGKRIEVEFLRKIRDVVPFLDEESLKRQLEKDKAEITKEV